ncbi:MAG: acyl carrier protein [Oscillospiraceae bacterium]|nr:acyl carrier protein [Oscillospiraceae bacterium]MDD6526215.1 acyl carrier protein [Oscillospiraceae bacterium]
MLERLIAILSNYTEVTDKTITEDTLILRDLGLNSYALAEMAGDVEDEFGIEFTDSELMMIKTVGDVLDYIGKHQ